jgi:putative NADH-flavin reductase
VSRTAVAPDAAGGALTMVAGDATDAEAIADLAPGHDAIVSAIGPSRESTDNPALIVFAAQALIDGARRSGVRRLLVVGGSGSLEVAPGKRLVDEPTFPEGWKPTALAHAEALALYRAADDLDWTFVSPAAVIEPGDRMGTYRRGGDELLVDAAGNSRIHIVDFALAFVDELEAKESIRHRITFAY